MKKIFNNITILFALILFNACDYDTLMRYEKNPDVYFTDLADASTYNDSSLVKFVFMDVNATETHVNISVTVTGKLSNTDRQVAVIADPQSTAKAGVHYEFPSTITIPAGSARASMSVRIIRSPDLNIDKKELLLVLSLQANDEFGVDFQTALRSGKNRSLVQYKIYISDILIKPLRWLDAYYGTYSDKKFLLICEVNNIVPAFMDGQEVNGKTFGTSNMFAIARVSKIYLEQQRLAGNTIYEDYLDENGDPVPMTMGPSA